ncbi:hypothetical protein G9U51_10715 [Calidifontibacter sp. DB0510]|uniref:Uncharacterized protein n=1 Tax=Metallococcus carri TaxID=1656884 RepID=A0A967B7M8_9MICO|nr:hypothetical protein [Metallococcus carri]NHN56246.1 hypothetical protein [Metallococcus carri]NOP38702.1 hypothetical protein [Calidifontibacter sp. DB2511S]
MRSSGELNLSGAGGTSSRHTKLEGHDLGLPGIAGAERRILTLDDPVVALTRTQSIAGGLEFTPQTSAGPQLQLACFFETRDQREWAVIPTTHPQGPDPRRPIFRATERSLSVNLRFVTELERFFVIALVRTPGRMMPGGTLTVGLYGGARLEIPLDSNSTYGAKALLTAYLVEGRLVLRAEHDPFSGTLQQVASVYGYDAISWRDPFTPLI